MPRTFLNIAVSRILLALALAFGAALPLPWGEARAATNVIQLSSEVPNGKTKSLRLRRLPRGAILSVRVRSSGRLQVALISAAQLKSKKPEALFRGALTRSLTFQVVVPEPGDYYLVLDNRRGTEPVKTRTTISAKRGPSGPSAPAEPPRKWPDEEKLEETRAALVPQA